jgi:hypothetical protein
MTDIDTETASAKPTEPSGSSALVVDVVIAAVLSGLCFVGIVWTDMAVLSSERYWLIVVAIFFVASFVVFWRHRTPQVIWWRLLLKLAVHWFGVLVAIHMVFVFIASGRMANTDAGLMASVLLGLSTYLSGVHGSWRMLLIGALILGGTVLATYVDQFQWLLLGLALVTIVLLVMGDRLFGQKRAAEA